ncbi:hypothetical protein IWW48_002721 [Coemansia sp. RSA 1200]|nr:hypothetical protein IWW48_002721 [Coemansia sp. RSA 1200]
MDKLREDWNKLKRVALMSPEHLRTLAFSGNVKGLPLRSLQWRLYLDLLPIESFGEGEDDDECRRVWGPVMEKERRNYEALRQTYVVDPNETTEPPVAAGEVADWRRMNPLSLDEDSPWNQYHRDQELRTTIAQDVGRTFPDQPYFRHPRVQKLMSDILLVYAKMHSSLQYRQGMHELLGPLLMVVDGDSVDTGGADGWFLGSVMDRRYVEHDAFGLFGRLMRMCVPWYQSPANFASPPLRPARRRNQQDGADEHRRAAIEAMKARAPIVAQCYGLLEKLESVDPRLASQLRCLDIEPQLFGIRWYRLLFSRELARLDDVVVLWGMLFADNAGGGTALRLVDWVGVVLLLANRRRLLAGDYADNLNTLLHLPPLPNPTQDTLDQTPALPSSPLPPNQPQQQQQQQTHEAVLEDALALAPRLPYSAVTQLGVLPVQRLALQAAYLRSHPSAEVARLIANQYEIWEDDAWDVIDETEAPKQPEQKQKSMADGGATHSREEPLSLPGARVSPISKTSASTVVGGGTLVASAPIAVSWQGRKMYTSNILQHRRTNGSISMSGSGYAGGALPSSGSKSSSPSSPLMVARKKTGGLGGSSGVGNSGWQAASSPVSVSASASASPPLNQIPLEVIAPSPPAPETAGDSGEECTDVEAIRALGSVTAQVTTVAAQCLDILAPRATDGTASRDHLDAMGGALHMLSRVWQDEVVRLSSTTSLVPPHKQQKQKQRQRQRQAGQQLDTRHSSSSDADASSSGVVEGVKSRNMSELDLRVVLRDLDRVYIELNNLKQ